MDNPILDALRKLDITNDNHWTADGQPRLDTVKMLAANPALKREDVETAAPGFTRSTAENYVEPTQASAQSGDAGAGATAQADNEAAAGAGAGAPVAQGNGGDGAGTFSDDEAKQPAVAGGVGSEPDEIASLEAQLAEAIEGTQEVREALDMVKAEFEKRRAREDDLRAKLEALRPVSNTTLAIQDYFASQDHALAERAARKALIKDSGIDLKQLSTDLQSPLDAAMARKNTRGSQRPQGKV